MFKSLNDKFMEEVSRIKEPEIFIGVARLLSVKLIGEEKDENGKFLPRDFNEIFSDVMKGFDGAGHKRKRELLQILHDANNAKEVK